MIARPEDFDDKLAGVHSLPEGAPGIPLVVAPTDICVVVQDGAATGQALADAADPRHYGVRVENRAGSRSTSVRAGSRSTGPAPRTPSSARRASSCSAVSSRR